MCDWKAIGKVYYCIFRKKPNGFSFIKNYTIEVSRILIKPFYLRGRLYAVANILF